ncbi:MAG: tetratricopeptide repeat protein [Myxococcaceae bacterium]|nr:tetratricopeptide repeat protein [Myxococcaceae bacterium]
MTSPRHALLCLALFAGGAGLAQTLPPNHPPIGTGSPAPADAPALETSQKLLEQLDRTDGLKERDKPFEIALSMGKLYYGNGRFEDAAGLLKQAVDKGEPVRTFYVAALKQARQKKLDLPNAETAGCLFAPTDSLQKQLETATQRQKSGQLAAAATCARVALEPVMEARQLYAGALINSGQTDQALPVLEESLATTPDDPDVLWTHAMALAELRGDDPKALGEVGRELRRYLALRPDSPRTSWAKTVLAHVEAAAGAGGFTRLDEQRNAEAHAKAEAAWKNAPKTAQAGLPAISPEAMEAIQNTERTPELMAGLQKLVEEAEEHLAHGRFQEALDNYKRVVPFEPQNGRARAGMAWAMIGLNRQPMADRVWQVAVQGDPKAVDALGTTLKEKGDPEGAKKLWRKLAESDPSYAASAGLANRVGP